MPARGKTADILRQELQDQQKPHVPQKRQFFAQDGPTKSNQEGQEDNPGEPDAVGEPSDGNNVVPSCTETLDISLPLDKFKSAILHLAKVLQIAGWLNIPDDRSSELSVSRISGALTNAVYLVSSPVKCNEVSGDDEPVISLLLRVYGPNVDNIVDRNNELRMLQRLSAHGIGPRLQGTFANGRFEQFINSATLTACDVREEVMSTFIARRMRELHDGVALLPLERYRGPVVWINLNNWVPRAKSIIAQRRAQGSKYLGKEGSDRVEGDIILGIKFHIFEAILRRYRDYMQRKYEPQQIRDQLVYCHNDAQYGNLLHLKYPNKNIRTLTQAHRQLVVIDFEYAGPNMRAFDLANHFCEWMPNYHTTPSYFLDETKFPSPEEVQQFLTAYVVHGHLIRSSALSTFNETSMLSSSNDSIKSFAARLTDRIPMQENNPVKFSKLVEEEVEKLELQMLDWRPASHAYWCAWGVVMSDEEKGQGEEETFFDYIPYANQRFKLFLGEMFRMGMLEDLLEEGSITMGDMKIIT